MSRPHVEAAEAMLVKVEAISPRANRVIMLLIAVVHAVLANREVLVEVRDAVKAEHVTAEKYSTDARRRMYP